MYCQHGSSSIINTSLSKGLDRESFKEAIVTSKLEKLSADTEEFSNYGKDSSVNFLSKLLEKVVRDQLHNHLSQHFLLDPLQYEHITTTTVVKQLRLWCTLTSLSHLTTSKQLYLFDLTAGLDNINHEKLH